MNLSKKLATTALATGALLVALAPSVFANAEIAGNGWGSKNTVLYSYSSETKVSQSNENNVNNHVVSVATTGDNYGKGDIHTGNATSAVGIEVNGGNNSASIPNCGCPENSGDIGIYGNGGWSHNGIYVMKKDTKELTQNSKFNVTNGVYSKADTGGNYSSDHNYKWWWGNNSSNENSTQTGSAVSAVSIAVTSGNNVAH